MAPVTADLCSTASDVKPALSEIVGGAAAASAAGRDSASSNAEPIIVEWCERNRCDASLLAPLVTGRGLPARRARAHSEGGRGLERVASLWQACQLLAALPVRQCCAEPAPFSS